MLYVRLPCLKDSVRGSAERVDGRIRKVPSAAVGVNRELGKADYLYPLYPLMKVTAKKEKKKFSKSTKIISNKNKYADKVSLYHS